MKIITVLFVPLKQRRIATSEETVRSKHQRRRQYSSEKKPLFYSHDQPYKHMCMQNHNNDTIKTRQSFRKIYLSLYLKGLCVRGSWWPKRTARYLPPLNRGPGGPLYWVLAFSTASCHQRVWSSNYLRGPEAPSAGCWLSLPHLLSKLSEFPVHLVI